MKEFLQNSTMQNDEKSKLEERVIAYFDGSLDNEGSRSLLREVAESPEKRALFKAHETLSRLIVAARTPMEAPLEVKRSIAERIPGMLAFIPGLLGTTEAVPVLTQNANPFTAFFARMSLTTAVSIGSAILLLTTGILLRNNFNSSRVPAPSKVAAVQNHSSAMEPLTQVPVQQALSKTVLNKTEGYHSVAGFAHKGMRELTPSEVPASTEDKDRGNSNVASLIPPISAMPISPAKADIPAQSTAILTPMPIVASEGITVRPYASTGERLVTLNGINGNSKNIMEPNYMFGLEFELGDHYAFHIQGGSSSFATLTKEQMPNMVAPWPVYQSKIVPQSAYWTTAGVSYSFPVIGSMPLILSADGGAVLLSNTGLMGILSAATEIPIFHQLLLRPSVSYDAVWTSLPGVGTSSGIYENQISQSSMWSTAVGFNISLIFRY